MSLHHGVSISFSRRSFLSLLCLWCLNSRLLGAHASKTSDFCFLAFLASEEFSDFSTSSAECENDQARQHELTFSLINTVGLHVGIFSGVCVFKS